MEQAKSRQSALILIGTLLSKLFSVSAVFTVSWIMGPKAMGLIAAAYAMVGLFRFVFDAGLPTTHIKKLSEGGDEATCIGTYLRLKLWTTAAGVVIVGAAIPLYLHAAHHPGSQDYLYVVLVILLARSLNSLTLVPLATFTATGQIARKQVIQIVQSAADCFFVILVAVFFKSILMLAVAHLLSEIVSGLLALRLFRGHAIRRPQPGQVRQYFRFSLPLLGSTIADSIYAHVDKLMLIAFLTPTVVGHYHAAWRVVFFFLMIPAAVSTILMPSASRYLANRRPDESGRIMVKAERYLSLVIAPICVGMAIFSVQVMSAFGPKYAAGGPVLAVLAGVCFIYSINRASATLLISLGRTKTILRMTVVLLLLNITLNALLIPASYGSVPMAGMGAPGAALATLLTAFAGLVATKVVVRKAIGVGLSPRIALHLAMALGAGFLSAVMAQALSPMAEPYLAMIPIADPEVLFPVAHGVIGCSVLVVLYGIGLVLVREIGLDEFRYVAATLNPRTLLGDIRRELRSSSSESNAPAGLEGTP